jgi:hypothetical protein
LEAIDGNARDDFIHRVAATSFRAARSQWPGLGALMGNFRTYAAVSHNAYGC